MNLFFVEWAQSTFDLIDAEGLRFLFLMPLNDIALSEVSSMFPHHICRDLLHYEIGFSGLVIFCPFDVFFFSENLIRYHSDFGFNPAYCVVILLLAVYFLNIFCWFCLTLGGWRCHHK